MQPESLSVEELTSTAALESIAPEWFALWQQDGRATPFQSPGWLVPWWKHIGQVDAHGELLSLALRDQGRLVAVLPLYIFTEPASGTRKLFPLGIATTDYLDGTYAAGYEDAAAARALAHLKQTKAAWDVFEFPQLRATSPFARLAAQPEPAEPCLVVDLHPEDKDLAASVPGRMMRNLRYYQSRADHLGEVQFEAATEATVDEVFQALVELHRCRWEARNQSGVLASANVASMHREAVHNLLAMGCLRLYAMRLNGAIVAVVYAIADGPDHDAQNPHEHNRDAEKRDDLKRDDRRTYSYLGGFNPALNFISPGTLLIGYAVQQALREGCTAFDFLRGEEAYKRLWGATERSTRRLVIERNRIMRDKSTVAGSGAAPLDPGAAA